MAYSPLREQVVANSGCWPSVDSYIEPLGRISASINLFSSLCENGFEFGLAPPDTSSRGSGGPHVEDKERCRSFLEQIASAAGSKNPAKAANGLIIEFGNLPATLNGTRHRQLMATGQDERCVGGLRRFKEMMRHALRMSIADRIILSNWQSLIDYLRADLAYRPTEVVRVLHLDSRNALIRDEVISRGTIDTATVHVREVIHRAMDLGSASMILAHNHPSGTAYASRADIDITRAIQAAGKALGISVWDHIIVGVDKCVSMRGEGLI